MSVRLKLGRTGLINLVNQFRWFSISLVIAGLLTDSGLAQDNSENLLPGFFFVIKLLSAVRQFPAPLENYRSLLSINKT